MEVLRVPLLNVNEDELKVVAVAVAEGDAVRVGEVVCTVESTKATMDVEAPAAGFVRRLFVARGDRVAVGAPLCAITETAEEPLPELPAAQTPSGDEVRATVRARQLAAEHGIDLASLGVRGIVTERHVRDRLGPAELDSGPTIGEVAALGDRPPAGERAVIYGAGGHARAVVDLLRESRRGVEIVGAVDDSPNAAADVLGVPVIGTADALPKLREEGVGVAVLGVGAVSDNRVRADLYQRLIDLGFAVPSLVHPRAVVEPSALLGRGNQVFAGAIVGANCRLGDNALINSGAVLSHDCVVRDHAHVTPGAILAGGVTVGEGTVVGMGVTIYLGVQIGRDAVIGNGVQVMHDIADGAVVRAALPDTESPR